MYKIGRGWAVLIYVLASLLIGVFGFILLSPFLLSGDESIKRIYPFLAPISVIMLGISVIVLLNTFKGRFIIDDHAVRSASTFSNQLISFTDIQGYRLDDNYIYIEPFGNGKRIKISNYTGGVAEIKYWLQQHYPDLDELEAQQDKQSILDDDNFGYTSVEREEKLKVAAKAAKIMNWSGGIVSAWLLLYPTPYKYVLVACISVPVICVIVVRYFRGLIKIVEKKGKAFPSVFFPLFFCSMAVLFRALLDFEIYAYKDIWAPAIIITVVISVLLFFGGNYLLIRRSRDYAALIITTVYLFGYGFGTVVALNCLYDVSKAEAYQSEVLSKRVSSGKSTTYYLQLSAWGPQREIDEVSVSKQLYRQFAIGDTATIYFRNGRFNIPWFEVKR